MKTIAGDVRHALRMLGKSPGFTAIAVITLAVGIGANSAIYSVADALVFHPLLLPDQDRLVFAGGVDPSRTRDLEEITAPDFLDWREQNRTIDDLAAYGFWSANITGGGEPEVVRRYRVTAGFFEALAVKPEIGRVFTPGEDEAATAQSAVLSYSLWQRRFGGDRAVLGTTVKLDGLDHQVIGVMPETVRFPADAEIWTPLIFTPAQKQARGAFYLLAVGRLKPGVTVDQANAEFRVLGERLRREYPDSHAKRGARVVLARELVSGDMTKQYTYLLMGAVGFLLLIACSNVANLQFARLSTRAREIAVRAALGAGRWRLARLLVTESVVLGIAGAAASVLIAVWGADLIRRSMPAEVEIFIPGWQRIGLNSRVLLFTGLLGLFSGVAAGLMAAFAGSRVNLNDVLKDATRGGGQGASRHRLRGVLVSVQILLAMVLLAGAGLIVKGFRDISQPLPNLDPEQVMTMRVALPVSRYKEPHQLSLFAGQLVADLKLLPGALQTGSATFLPYSSARSSSSFEIENIVTPPGPPFLSQMESVSGDYFGAMRIPIRSGRDFALTDGTESPRVAVVNEAFVRQYLPKRDPLGRRVRLGRQGPWTSIVGVVGDIRHNFSDRTVRPVMYRPSAQTPSRTISVAIRTAGDPMLLARAMREVVHSIDPDQPVAGLLTMKKVISDSLVGLAYVAWLLGVFGILALALSAIGVYSLTACTVNERTHEIGVRMALGAAESSVMWMMLRRGLWMTIGGLALGVPAAMGMAHLLKDLIFGVSTTDVAALGGVAALLAASALLACYIPARRATRVDPIEALRYE